MNLKLMNETTGCLARMGRRGAALALTLAVGVGLAIGPTAAHAFVNIQCPGDTTGDAIIDTPDPLHPDAVCVHLAAGDGFVTMGDGYPQYVFGFSDVTGVQEGEVLNAGILGANFPAPTISVDEGQELYLTLTNVGMLMRPDLFDPHTVHWHGFPNASAVFDGLPDASVAIKMQSSLTYYYVAPHPGTYMYHCHAEATEHMQMGMLGSLYVRPRQNKLPAGTALGNFVHQDGFKYVYNDGDGSTYYDVEFPLQLGSFDQEFHDASRFVQPLPFAFMEDDYGMINGRGYPDTVNPGALPASPENGGLVSQPVSSLVTATAGQKILLRLSNLAVTEFYTLASSGLPMTVVGKDARELVGPTGIKLHYDTTSVTMGGGESYDVIIDTAGIAPGTYYLYASQLNYLSNNDEDFGGMMTEVVIN